MKSRTGKKNERQIVGLPEEATGLFRKNYDRTLVDESLSDKDVVLLSLYLIERQANKAGVDYKRCKELFVALGRKEPNFSVNIHNAKKEGLIEQNDSILYFLSGGLKRIAQLLGQVQKAPVYVIKSGQNFSAIKRLEEFLAQEVDSEDFLLCDPYVSTSTLFPFSELKPKSIKILTTQIHDTEKFREYRNKMQTETGTRLDVKISRKIHDRYLIAGNKCWSFGASIKDLGNKDTTIREISEVTKSMKELFLERWDESLDLGEK